MGDSRTQSVYLDKPGIQELDLWILASQKSIIENLKEE